MLGSTSWSKGEEKMLLSLLPSICYFLDSMCTCLSSGSLSILKVASEFEFFAHFKRPEFRYEIISFFPDEE